MAVDLLATLQADPALTVAGHPGWKTRGRSGLKPEGIVLHHTASSVRSGPHGSLPILVNGRTGIPGPLCNLSPGRDGTVIVVAAGVANHAGRNSTTALNEMAAGKVSHLTRTAAARGLVDDVVGNTRTIGIEIEHSGLKSEPWRLEVITAVVHVCAALCRHFGWTSGHVTEHRLLTARKPDPTGTTDWWSFIDSLLAPPAPPTQGDTVGIVVRDPHTGALLEVTEWKGRHITTVAEAEAILNRPGAGPQSDVSPALLARRAL